MADRSSAAIFSLVFTELAKLEQTPQVKKLVRKLWKESGNYDFSDCQMECDKVLVKLGLCKINKDADGYEEAEYKER
jgi:hypothetical protein